MRIAKIKSIRKIQPDVRYDIEVENTHNYFANGILVHNCTTMYNDWVHARSMDGKHHPSRNWVKGLWATCANDIPENMRICGENMFAEHSIRYDALTSYFYVFGIYVDEICLSWDDTVEYCKLFGLEHVPVLYRGPWNEEIVKACMTGESAFGGRQEGYVVRNVEAFPYDEFDKNCGKFVRKSHVQTDQNWMYQPVVPNGLAEDSGM